jgi:hypothetical protein
MIRDRGARFTRESMGPVRILPLPGTIATIQLDRQTVASSSECPFGPCKLPHEDLKKLVNSKARNIQFVQMPPSAYANHPTTG